MSYKLNLKIAGFVILSVLFSMNISAQGQGGPGQGGPGRGQQMTEKDIEERADQTAKQHSL